MAGTVGLNVSAAPPLRSRDSPDERPPDARTAAIRRIKAKRDFKTHVVIYVVVNLMLVAIWAFSGAGFFWPVFSILFWGVGLVFNGWSAFYEGRAISEDEIRREMGE